MDDKIAIYQREESLAVITITGLVDCEGAFADLAYQLCSFGDQIGIDKKLRVLVLTDADDGSFSMGAGFTDDTSELDVIPSGELCTMTESIANLDLPVIAAINGDAIGLGLELALACDIRIAADTAHFGFPHIKEGLIPWDGGTQRLSRVVGQARAMEMILTGELIDAQEAYRVGLVSKVVAPEEVMPVTMDMAREMASKGPIALRYAKEAIHKGMDLTLEQGLRLEADLYFLLHTTKDRTEGIKAFREKRTPEFEGR
jgi:enoyl-CoA hydratase/carnithine racemase